MIESRKQAVSIRMNASDVRKVKKLAGRLGVRDSDVIRFAVKGMLARLGPLYEPEVRGRASIPFTANRMMSESRAFRRCASFLIRRTSATLMRMLIALFLLSTTCVLPMSH